MRKLCFYDPHSRLNDEHFLTVGEHRYHLELLQLGEMVADLAWVFVMDELLLILNVCCSSPRLSGVEPRSGCYRLTMNLDKVNAM